MKIQLSLFGAFREMDAAGAIQLELPDAAAVGDLRAVFDGYARAHWPAYRPGLLQCSAFASEIGILRDHEAIPADGRMAILPPVSGG
jgi:molybdopterin synthase sulfur carrier subunit